MKHEYEKLLSRKKGLAQTFHSVTNADIHPALFPFQKDIVEMLLRIGRGAAFLDTGLGKTIVQCEWARHIPGEVLIVAPLAVSQQTIREAKKHLDMDISYSKDGSINGRVTITNYERLDGFDHERFAGIVLDESSILKGQSSKMRAFLTKAYEQTPYKLACTATPAPNDYTELGNHSEFLGIMSQQEMLMRWFLHDSANTGDWRLKGHAVKPFWEWVSSWAACVSKPSDLGYSNEGYDLPKLTIKTHVVNTPIEQAFEKGMLFELADSTSATELHREKRKTAEDRIAIVADMVNRSSDQWLVWCESNQESEMLKQAIPDAVEVKGSDKPDVKEDRLLGFTDGRHRVLISKPSICGFGMNWQQCTKIAFASISYSYEKFYQAIRRSWRFGQTKPVDVHVVIAEAERDVWATIERKSMDHDTMKDHMKYAVFSKGKESQIKIDYNPNHKAVLPDWL